MRGFGAIIVDALNQMGSKCDYRVSESTQSSSVYKSERYELLCKTAQVQLLKSPYHDSELSSVCDREPYIGLFKPKKEGEPFYIINFHSRRFNAYSEE